MQGWLLEYRCPRFYFPSAESFSFQVVKGGGKNCRAGLPFSLGDNNCCRVSLIEQMERDLNFPSCALHWLAGSQCRSRSSEGILTSGVHELPCPAKISDQTCKWAGCKADFSHWLPISIGCVCLALSTWLSAWFCIGLWVLCGPAARSKRLGLKNLLAMCYNVPNFLEKTEAFEVLNVSLNGLHILHLMQWDFSLFRICSGPSRVSPVSGKEAIIDTKTPGSWQYFFSIAVGFTVST